MNVTEVSYLEAVEQHFRAARGTGSFYLSPRDWAVVESWEKADIPLVAVLRGIDATFEKRRRRQGPGKLETINSIAYCAQAIAQEAQAIINASSRVMSKETKPPFPIEEVRSFVTRNIRALQNAGHEEIAESLESLDLDALFVELGQLEQRLTEIEEKMVAQVRASASEELLCAVACEIDRELKHYRNTMTSDQIATLESKFLERRLLEAARLPRLSLFYL